MSSTKKLCMTCYNKGTLKIRHFLKGLQLWKLYKHYIEPLLLRQQGQFAQSALKMSEQTRWLSVFRLSCASWFRKMVIVSESCRLALGFFQLLEMRNLILFKHSLNFIGQVLFQFL